MIADPKKPSSSQPDAVPENIQRRPLRLSPMRKVKQDGPCHCRKPIFFEHPGGHVTCIRCRRDVEDADE